MFHEKHQPDDTPEPKSKYGKLLAAMAGMSMPASMIGVLGRFAGIELKADDWKYLEGPIVQHESAWRDTTPKWMYEQVIVERSEIVFGQADPRLIVGPTEIACVMYPACMEHPMVHEAVELYSWATVNASARAFKHEKEQLWRNICGDDRREWLSDDDVLGGGRRAVGQFYQDLSREIRRKVIAQSKYRHEARRQLEERAGEAAPAAEVRAVLGGLADRQGGTYDLFERFQR